ncbi:MAG: DUF6660 family protein [Chitinophagales bacterium]
MKYLVFIFSIYVLALSVVPCSDIKNECFNQKATEKQHHHNQDADDNCTPFCTCTCCINGVTIANPQHLVTDNFYTSTTIEKIPTFNTQFISSFEGNIWQPPKI